VRVREDAEASSTPQTHSTTAGGTTAVRRARIQPLPDKIGTRSAELSQSCQGWSAGDLVLGTIIIPFCITIGLHTMPVLPIIAVGFSPCAAGRHIIVALFEGGFIGVIAPVETGAIAPGAAGAVAGGVGGAGCATAARESARNAAPTSSAARGDLMVDLSARGTGVEMGPA
jgi:hypothetical protein